MRSLSGVIVMELHGPSILLIWMMLVAYAREVSPHLLHEAINNYGERLLNFCLATSLRHTQFRFPTQGLGSGPGPTRWALVPKLTISWSVVGGLTH